MARQVAFLRGVNVGSHNRVAMTELRHAIAGAGFGEVRTYLQSGNVVLSSDEPAREVELEIERQLTTRFGLDVRVVVRTGEELAAVVRLDPLRDVASDPKRYQVTFLSAELEPAVLARLEAAAVEPERCLVLGRELYAWHPEGIARSPLWSFIAGRGLGVTATARNWTTVTSLLALLES